MAKIVEVLAVEGGKRTIPEGLVKSWPIITDEDKKAVLDVLDRAQHSSGLMGADQSIDCVDFRPIDYTPVISLRSLSGFRVWDVWVDGYSFRLGGCIVCMLTPKERVYRAVAHEETDVVPYNIPINSRAHKRLAEVYGEGFDRDIVNHIVGVPVDIRTFPPDDVVGDWEDEFGCVWRQSRDGAPHLVKHALSKPSLKGYEFPDFSGAERYRDVPRAIEAHRDRFTVLGLGVAFFERSWALRGFEQIMVDFHRRPDFVEELLDRLTELHSRTIDRFVKHNIDAVQFGDDFGMQKGLLMGPRIWRKFLKPRLRQIYGRAKKAGKLVMIHSCGDNSEIMGDLIEIGVDIFNPTQPEAMDIFELKRMWGSQITFNGGVTTQRLAFYTPEQIGEEVRCVRGFMAKGGGFVLETTKPIRWDVPPETAMALIEEVTKPSE